MRKHVVLIVSTLMFLLIFSGCATSEERMARAAEMKKKVVIALGERKYKICINRMMPLRGISKSVSYGYSVEVRNDSLISYLPFFGRAYNVPYGGGKGLNFSAPIHSYQEYQKRKDMRYIEIGLANDEDTFLYIIQVFDNGSTSVEVQSRQRERISYSGELEL